MFENKMIKGTRFETYASRWIASWVKMGGEIPKRGLYGSKFAKWLKSEGVSDEDIRYVCNLMDNGKLELQASALQFIHYDILK